MNIVVCCAEYNGNGISRNWKKARKWNLLFTMRVIVRDIKERDDGFDKEILKGLR